MSHTKPLLIVLLGATASGKTNLAIDIAQKLNLSIHNIDSRQVYKGMNIGTAKPTPVQQQKVKHYLIDIRTPDRPITLHEFQEEAKSTLNQVLAKKPIGFLVGGSGLYLKAITYGYKPSEVAPQQNLRNQ